MAKRSSWSVKVSGGSVSPRDDGETWELLTVLTEGSFLRYSAVLTLRKYCFLIERYSFLSDNGGLSGSQYLRVRT
jgi:hypothetical protein